MKAFDADIVTLIFHGDAAIIQKAAQIPVAERSIPIVVAEQKPRGRLNSIRQAETGKSKAGIAVAYFFLEQTIDNLKRTRMLSFTPQAESLVQNLAKTKKSRSARRTCASPQSALFVPRR